GAQTFGGEAGQDVDVVVRGAGDEGVGTFDAGGLEVVGIGARTPYETHVEGLEPSLPVGVDVEDRDAVLLVQLCGDQRSDLTATDDLDVHEAAMLAPPEALGYPRSLTGPERLEHRAHQQ